MNAKSVVLVLGGLLIGCAPSPPAPERVGATSPSTYGPSGGAGASGGSEALIVERVSAKVPFPRGLALVDSTLYVLARGRVREYGGVSGEIDDQAGTIYAIDPEVGAPVDEAPPERVRHNGRIVAAPTAPPFRLFDRSASPATSDRLTDRPYCALRYDPASRNLFLCAFSGIDKQAARGERNFSKNLSDGLLRLDLRTGRWHEVERHDVEAGGTYPHHDPATRPPPHGWLNGPDNCLVVGDWLYAVAKDNSLLVRYDLRALRGDPEAGPPPGCWALGDQVHVRGLGLQRYQGHSALAARDGHLYLGYRTSSVIVRLPLAPDGTLRRPVQAELLARFDPYDPRTGKSANLTDMDIDAQGRVYVVSASPARIYRFTPDPAHVFDARAGAAAPWVDLAAVTGNPKMKSENVLVDPRGRVFVTAGDAYGDEGLGGVVYRVSAAP